jgi:hypothetical protein
MPKITLHHGSATDIPAADCGQDADSGNGYYSYNWYLLPYTGSLTDEALRAVQTALRTRHYRPPFASLHSVERHGIPRGGRNGDGGVLLVGLTYHHGD